MKKRTLTKRRAELSADPVSSPVWTARRVGIVAVLVCLLFLAGMLGVSVFLDGGPVPPTFRRLTAADIGDGYTYLGLEKSMRESIHGDGLWFHLYDANMSDEEYRGTYLFDLTTGEVVGEVVDGVGAVYDAETSTVLCYAEYLVDLSPVQSFARRRLDQAKEPIRSLFTWMGITVPSWLSASSYGSGWERFDFWVLNLYSDEATYLGQIVDSRPTAFYFRPSPDGRWTMIQKSEFAGPRSVNHLVDMDLGIMRPFPAPGRPIGWWDADSFLTWTDADGIRLVDVATGTHSMLLGPDEVTGLLNQAGIADPGSPYPFLSWNGRYDLYFTETSGLWDINLSTLVKYDRAEGRLELITQDFKFALSGCLDREGRYYIFSGGVQGVGVDGVIRRDLHTGEERTLVAPTTTGNRWSSVTVLRDEWVIYRRTNELWSVSIEGSEHKRLFPPD